MKNTKIKRTNLSSIQKDKIIRNNRNLNDIRLAINSLPNEYSEQRNIFSKIFLTPVKNQSALTDFGVAGDIENDTSLRTSETYDIAQKC